jgi:AcrR family transcriptional regulator
MSPRSKQQFEQIKEDRRAQILDAALSVFARRGLAATKIGDIAEQAGLSHGLVYHYFASKDDIFVELVRIAEQSAQSALQQAEALPLPPLEKLRAITAMMLQTMSGSNQSALYFTVMAQATLSDSTPAQAQAILARFDAPVGIMARIIAQGQADGTLRNGDPEVLSLLFWSTVQGLSAYRLIQQHPRTLDPALLMRLFEPA